MADEAKAFWDALYGALVARRIDPYTAKAVRAHVQSIMLPYIDALREHPDMTPEAFAAFILIFIGED